MLQDIVDNILINDREPERIPQIVIRCQPGMFAAESQAGTQPFTDLYVVDTLVKKMADITFNRVLLYTADWAAWLVTGLE